MKYSNDMDNVGVHQKGFNAEVLQEVCIIARLVLLSSKFNTLLQKNSSG